MINKDNINVTPEGGQFRWEAQGQNQTFSGLSQTEEQAYQDAQQKLSSESGGSSSSPN
jgi:hypothetical protein